MRELNFSAKGPGAETLPKTMLAKQEERNWITSPAAGNRRLSSTRLSGGSRPGGPPCSPWRLMAYISAGVFVA